MRYDYECESCLRTQEEWHPYKDRPLIICNKCGGKCVKLIGCPSGFVGVGTPGMYDFVDHNTTGKPVRIHGRRQWKNHLKSLGLNDDVKNDPLTKSDVEQMQRNNNNKKIENRRKIKESVVDIVRNIPRSKLQERAKQVIKKGGK